MIITSELQFASVKQQCNNNVQENDFYSTHFSAVSKNSCTQLYCPPNRTYAFGPFLINSSLIGLIRCHHSFVRKLLWKRITSDILHAFLKKFFKKINKNSIQPLHGYDPHSAQSLLVQPRHLLSPLQQGLCAGEPYCFFLFPILYSLNFAQYYRPFSLQISLEHEKL